eukprot:2912470-Pyramimonas_sp.AAC.2
MAVSTIGMLSAAKELKKRSMHDSVEFAAQQRRVVDAAMISASWRNNCFQKEVVGVGQGLVARGLVGALNGGAVSDIKVAIVNAQVDVSVLVRDIGNANKSGPARADNGELH